MTVARENVRALVCDDEMYVMGGCETDEYSANWTEVFNRLAILTKTQSWTALPGLGADEVELLNLLREGNRYNIGNVFEGKLYIVVDEKEYAYDPKDGAWKFVRQESCFRFGSLAVWCDIENIIYGCTWSGILMWFDSKTEGREWREIKGLGELLEDHRIGLRTGREFDMVNYGGKLLVMWKLPYIQQKNKIWYAKISLESRCNGREIWGKVKCVDELTFPVESYKSFRCIKVSV